MTLWNWSNEKVKRLYDKFYNLCEYISIYFHKEFYIWYLFKDALFPLSYRQSFKVNTDTAWEYHPDKQILKWRGSDLDQTEYSIAWLSASIKSAQRESEMDTFLSTLRIHTHESKDIPLSILLQAWSIYDRHWWIQDPTHKIKWIDELANEQEVGVRENHSVPITPVLSSLKSKKIET
jgi:hypothetical protein